jgi:hypothetical protein
MYRQSFAFNAKKYEEIRKQELPRTLQMLHQTDATMFYQHSASIVIPCDLLPEEENKAKIFLCVFSPNGWIAIDEATEHKNNKCIFRDVQLGVFYGVCYLHDGELLPAAYPFSVGKEDIGVVIYHPTFPEREVKLTRKWPYSTKARSHIDRMRHGRFEGANRRDFSDAVTLYELGLTEIPTRIYNECRINNKNRFRFVRYISDIGKRGDIAEIEWYNTTQLQQKMTGRLISTPGYNGTNHAPENAIDGDPATFFSSAYATGWVGLDLGEQQQIARIVYMPRNDDNFIRKGDTYNIYFFSSNGWKSLGKQVGTETEELIYKVPSNALFWLRDLTRGKEEQIFAIDEGGRQLFNYNRDRKL